MKEHLIIDNAILFIFMIIARAKHVYKRVFFPTSSPSVIPYGNSFNVSPLFSCYSPRRTSLFHFLIISLTNESINLQILIILFMLMKEHLLFIMLFLFIFYD